MRCNFWAHNLKGPKGPAHGQVPVYGYGAKANVPVLAPHPYWPRTLVPVRPKSTRWPRTRMAPYPFGPLAPSVTLILGSLVLIWLTARKKKTSLFFSFSRVFFGSHTRRGFKDSFRGLNLASNRVLICCCCRNARLSAHFSTGFKPCSHLLLRTADFFCSHPPTTD